MLLSEGLRGDAGSDAVAAPNSGGTSNHKTACPPNDNLRPRQVISIAVGRRLVVVGQPENVDKSDKWWITGDLDPAGLVGILWITMRLAFVSCDTSYPATMCGGRRSEVVILAA